MSQPTVCAVMLVDGRPEMTRRAIASFRAQTYEDKTLLIYDTTRDVMTVDSAGTYHVCAYDQYGKLIHTEEDAVRSGTIGALRNRANELAAWRVSRHSLIAHWDSDDWSHPRRLAEQVALLEASGKACVGFREVLFWDTRPVGWPKGCGDSAPADEELVSRPEAWIYRNPDPRWVCGASMMYRREAWEACPFEDAPGEDQLWWLKNAEKCLGDVMPHPMLADPRMICGIHGQNTEAYRRHDSAPGKGDGMLSGGNGVWFRAPEWDEYAGRTMRL